MKLFCLFETTNNPNLFFVFAYEFEKICRQIYSKIIPDVKSLIKYFKVIFQR